MSSTDRFDRAMELFDRACDLPPEKRKAFLEEACVGDADLLEEVEALIENEQNECDAIAAAERGDGADAFAAALGEGPEASDQMPESISGYRLVRKVGQGGMGVIYEAQQESPRRRVALKVLRPGMMGPSMLKRFQHEAHVLGQLQHAGIAQIFESGLADSQQGRQPFFAMEFIEGEPLDRYAATRQFDTNQRLELLARVCDAVQHAHQKGIVHRDLKPSNVLVVRQHVVGTSRSALTSSSTGSVVDLIGQPKVLDFGIARVTDADIQAVTVQTEVGQLVGTLPYMSPEQVAGNSADLDTRCDVYALGVMLYQLLTGSRPHDLTGLSIAEAARIIREEEPPTVGAIDKALRGDVATIVAKAMDKDRERRYASAAELAADIRHFLQHEPIDARPASTFYQMRRFAKRNKGLVGGMVATFVMLTIGLVGTGIGLYKATEQRDAAVAAQEATRQEQRRLRKVARFQSQMVQRVEIQTMGQHLVEDIRAEVEESLSRMEGRTDEQHEQDEQSLSRLLSLINGSDLARKTMDVNILSTAADTIERDFADQPRVEAELRASLSEAYINLGLYQQAVSHAERSLVLHRELYGDDDPLTLGALSAACESLQRLGMYDQAEPYCLEALERRSAVLGDDHEKTLESNHFMGCLNLQMDKPAEAETYMTSALQGRQRVLGDDDPDTLETMAYLSAILLELEKPIEGERHLRAALDGRRRVLGDQHPRTLDSLRSLGRFLDRAGKRDEAELYYREVLEAGRKNEGDNALRTLSSISDLGTLLMKMRRLDEALPLLREALEGRTRILGPEHPITLVTMSNLAVQYVYMNEPAKAEPLMRRILEVYRRTLGEDHRRTIRTTGNLVGVLFKLNRLEDAEVFAREVVTSTQRVRGNDHRNTILAWNNLGRVLFAQGKFADAHEQFAGAVAAARRILKERQEYRQKAISNLGDVLIELDRPAEAEPLFREILAIRRKHLPENHEMLGRTLRPLGRSLLMQQKYDEAHSTLSEALTIHELHLAEDNWQIHFTRSMMGEALTAQGKYAEAERLLIPSFQNLEQQDSASSASGTKRVRDARSRIVQLYDAWGRSEEAEKWRVNSRADSTLGPSN